MFTSLHRAQWKPAGIQGPELLAYFKVNHKNAKQITKQPKSGFIPPILEVAVSQIGDNPCSTVLKNCHTQLEKKLGAVAEGINYTQATGSLWLICVEMPPKKNANYRQWSQNISRDRKQRFGPTSAAHLAMKMAWNIIPGKIQKVSHRNIKRTCGRKKHLHWKPDETKQRKNDNISWGWYCSNGYCTVLQHETVKCQRMAT